jgi:hypothetical protein
MWIKASVKADREGHGVLLQNGETLSDTTNVEIDGLLAKDRLAGAGRQGNHVDVGIRGRAYKNSVNGGIVD